MSFTQRTTDQKFSPLIRVLFNDLQQLIISQMYEHTMYGGIHLTPLYNAMEWN